LLASDDRLVLWARAVLVQALGRGYLSVAPEPHNVRAEGDPQTWICRIESTKEKN